MSWRNPMPGRVSSPFGPRRSPGGIGTTMHRGVDIAAPAGTAVLAAAAGVVTVSTYNAVRGHLVIVDHGGGISTLYQHLQAPGAPTGRAVDAGERIGRCGSSGASTGPHLHFELRQRGTPVDPVPYLAARGITIGEDHMPLTPEDIAAVKTATTEAVRIAVHGLIDEAAQRSTPTGRALGDDIAALVASAVRNARPAGEAVDVESVAAAIADRAAELLRAKLAD